MTKETLEARRFSLCMPDESGRKCVVIKSHLECLEENEKMKTWILKLENKLCTAVIVLKAIQHKLYLPNERPAIADEIRYALAELEAT